MRCATFSTLKLRDIRRVTCKLRMLYEGKDDDFWSGDNVQVTE